MYDLFFYWLSDMTDPFFKLGPNTDKNIEKKNTDQDKKKIELLLSMQNDLEKEFLKLNDHLKSPDITKEKKDMIQEQMQKLDFEYKKNASVLKTFWIGSSSEKAKVAVKNKSWSKISVMQFAIWCVFILFLLVWWLATIFYYLVSNPTQMSSVWITPQTAKTLLQTFVVIFFGFLFLLWFGLLIVNAYRRSTVKNKSKFWYILGTIFGFFIFIFSLVLGSVLLSRISNISVGDLMDPYSILRPYLRLYNNDRVYIFGDNNLKLIAPWVVSFGINKSLLDSQIISKLWQSQIQSIKLNCGNGQMLDIDLSIMKEFDWFCAYYTKWNYPLNLTISYINVQTSERLENSFSVWALDFEAEIKVSNNDDVVRNVPLDVIVWKVPSKVNFDASEVFTNFDLGEYKVVWYLDWIGNVYKEDLVSVSYVYKEAKVYNIWVKFPGLNNYLYSFPMRVEQSDVPICEISYNLIKWSEYNIKANFLDLKVWITDYQFDIFDNNSAKIIDSIKNKNWYINYTLPAKWTYSIISRFITDEWKSWKCESEDIEVGSMSFDVLYDIYLKSPQSPNFVKIDLKNSNIFSNWSLIINEIPTVLKIDITKITPNNPGLTKLVTIDSKPILSSDGKSYEVTLDENKSYEISIIIEDINRGTKSEYIIPVEIKRNDIVWKLIITPDTVGNSPFTVQLDASTTTVNDPKDEIVYFTWDFGDWEVKKNFSQSVVSHTYKYDTKNENWEYFPKVTIKTRNWREIVIWSWMRVIVKKSIVNLKINIDSHPAQVAKAWDKVDFSLEMIWLPKTMRWDFGDWNDLECNARECVTASKVYNEAWTYNVRVFVTFEDQPDVEDSINIKIQ